MCFESYLLILESVVVVVKTIIRPILENEMELFFIGVIPVLQTENGKSIMNPLILLITFDINSKILSALLLPKICSSLK